MCNADENIHNSFDNKASGTRVGSIFRYILKSYSQNDREIAFYSIAQTRRDTKARRGTERFSDRFTDSG